MRERELKPAKAIETFLRSCSPKQEVSSEPGQDPPDFYLHVGTETYPLEVTSTEVWHDPSIGQGQVRERTYIATHKELVRELETEAVQARALCGQYDIRFARPLSTQDYARKKAQFKEETLQFLRNSKDESEGFGQKIVLDNRRVASITKFSEEGQRLYASFWDGAWTETPEFIAFCRDMLASRIEAKADTLAQHNVQVGESILAIQNTYALADRTSILQACDTLRNEMSRFHSVFLINEGQVLALHSRNPNWITGDAQHP
jgi:hypothetical protein